MKFTEAKLEQAFIHLLHGQGYSHELGGAIERSLEEVIIIEDLKNFLATQYQDQQITQNEIDQIVRELQVLTASDLYESNKTFMAKLSNGFQLKREDPSKKDLLDFYMGDEVKDQFKLIEKDINEL